MDDVPAPLVYIRIANVDYRCLKTIPYVEGNTTAIGPNRVASVEAGHKVVSREFAALSASIEPRFSESHKIWEVQRL